MVTLQKLKTTFTMIIIQLFVCLVLSEYFVSLSWIASFLQTYTWWWIDSFIMSLHCIIQQKQTSHIWSEKKRKNASAGNRTQIARVEAEDSTTEIQMLVLDTWIIGIHEFWTKNFSAQTFGPVRNSADFSVRTENPIGIWVQFSIKLN